VGPRHGSSRAETYLRIQFRLGLWCCYCCWNHYQKDWYRLQRCCCCCRQTQCWSSQSLSEQNWLVSTHVCCCTWLLSRGSRHMRLSGPVSLSRTTDTCPRGADEALVYRRYVCMYNKAHSPPVLFALCPKPPKPVPCCCCVLVEPKPPKPPPKDIVVNDMDRAAVVCC